MKDNLKYRHDKYMSVRRIFWALFNMGLIDSYSISHGEPNSGDKYYNYMEVWYNNNKVPKEGTQTHE